MNSIQDKLKGLQQTQKTMRLAVEGPTTEKLNKDVQQVAAQSDVEVVVIKVEMGGLHSKIAAPAE